ncbi:hypothetical protein AKJ08_3165 [Vulgatibacter incomptus]|uniref:Uncharacterized protein n=1 Tax=Vulgatibacter incomptus TaxID=1391653 RepID=A0A0K1PGX1_9BACT|nr:hypothetical protein AKJ08_3165 [Vulgatibacter incomptus]
MKNSQALASRRRANEKERSRAKRELKKSGPLRRGRFLHTL